VKKSKNLNFSKIFQNFENGYSAFKYPWGVVQYGMGFVFVHSTLNYLGNFRSVVRNGRIFCPEKISITLR